MAHRTLPGARAGAWQAAAGITEGPVFRRIWLPPRARGAGSPRPARVGTEPIDRASVALIVQARAAAAGFGAATSAATA